MADVEDRLTTMEKHLHNQEKRLRYHRITVGMLAVCFIMTLGTHVGAQFGRNAVQPPVQPPVNQVGSTLGEVKRTKLTVVNSTGQTMVELSAGGNSNMPGGRAIIFGENGTRRIGMGSDGYGKGHLKVLDGGGQHGRVELDMGANGGRITVGDATGLSEPVAGWGQ